MTRATLLVLAFAVTAPAADPVKELEARLQKVIDDAAPSVVSVVVAHAKYPARFEEKGPGRLGKYEATLPMPRFRPRLQADPPPDPLDLSDPANAGDHTFGAGIVLDAASRRVLTAYHLIDGATKIYVRGSKGKGSYANVRAADARSDLAVLELIDPVEGLAAARLAPVQLVAAPNGAKPNLKPGSFVVAVGHPLAAGAADGVPSGSWGILSGVRRRSAPVPGSQRDDIRNKPLHTYGSLLQTDARVTLGSSGSAVLNLDGEVIGMASSVAAVSGSEASGGYALPMDLNYRRIIALLAAGKEVEYGFLGVLPAQTVSGVEVSAVTAGCPAAEADLRPGDVLAAVDGNPLKNTDDLHLYVGAALAGSKVTMTVVRGRQEMKVDLVLAKNYNQMPFLATVQPPAVSGLHVDYASIRYAQAGAIPGRSVPVYPVPGVAVREVDAGSAAEKKLADAGDISRWVISQVDGKAVANPAAFHAAVAGKASVKLTLTDITTANKSMTVVLP